MRDVLDQLHIANWCILFYDSPVVVLLLYRKYLTSFFCFFSAIFSFLFCTCFFQNSISDIYFS